MNKPILLTAGMNGQVDRLLSQIGESTCLVVKLPKQLPCEPPVYQENKCDVGKGNSYQFMIIADEDKIMMEDLKTLADWGCVIEPIQTPELPIEKKIGLFRNFTEALAEERTLQKENKPTITTFQLSKGLLELLEKKQKATTMKTPDMHDEKRLAAETLQHNNDAFANIPQDVREKINAKFKEIKSKNPKMKINRALRKAGEFYKIKFTFS